MRNHMPLRTFASSFVLIVSFVTAGSIAPAAAPPLDAAARQATARRVASRVAITVPAEDAELTVNGAAVPGSGMSRTFDTGLIAEGTHKYTVSVTWEPNTYTKMTRTKDRKSVV